MRASRLSATIDLDRPGKQAGFVRLPHSTHASAYGWIPIPIQSIRNGRGPRVLLVSGNHGDEYEGQVALMKLGRALAPEDITGSLTILSAANFPAAMAGRRVSPVDDGNLNRAFPGDPDGTVTQQIAFWIEHVLLPRHDAVIDLHSGGSSLMYMPSALIRRRPDPDDLTRSLALLRAFGAPTAYVAETPQGADQTLTAAAERKGVLHLGTELGGGGMVGRAALAIAEAGLRRALAHLGVLPAGAAPPIATPTRVLTVGGADYYVYAPDGGVFEPLAEPGDEVAADQPAGIIHFPDTPWRAPSTACFARAGLVLCRRVPGRTERGDCLYHLGTDYAG